MNERIPPRKYLLLAALTGLLAALPVVAQEGNPGVQGSHWTNDQPVGDGGGPVTASALEESPTAANWLHYGGNYQQWRHSPITSLTPSSIGDLRPAWMLPTGISVQFEASPVVYDGVMYVTSSYNRLFALDAASGKILWRYDHKYPVDLRICCGPINRGAAISGNAVLMATLDARLIAFDRKSGEILWDVEIAPYAKGLSSTSAPLVVGDVAVIGVGGGEYGVRGFFDGYDIETGERRWRHYTIPTDGEPGIETWAGDSYKSGGGATWVSGSYDPDTDTLFWAAGNPSPDWNGDLRAGDNLYSDAILAVDPRTGDRKWHFQATPHDVWDYDGNSEIWVVDIEHDGATVPAVVQANRNGYFYAIDRRNGDFLFAKQFVDQLNWATLDENGRPIVDPKMMPQDEPTQRVCPGLAGGNQGSYAGAYSPETGLAYVPVIESCMMFRKGIVVFVEGIPFMGGEPVAVDTMAGKSYGHLSAIDVSTGETKWRYEDPYPMMAGVLSTAGGVVVTGNMEGHILAFNAESGEEVWRFNAGSTIRSHPVAYQADGRTFLAVGIGGGGVVEAVVGRPAINPNGGVLMVFELP
ncbi:MAG: PQQ-dependent dehydrogenase, methanol/ethanol family [Acidobacteriota bacterium]|nr:PQQ-dependent dehydrogenase, methanol/ethanol family [Acidobacteriota bacterium]